MKKISKCDLDFIESEYGTITTLKETDDSIYVLIPEFGEQTAKIFKFVGVLDKVCGGNTVIKHMNNDDGIMNITLGIKDEI